jgi:hypothetical protein
MTTKTSLRAGYLKDWRPFRRAGLPKWLLIYQQITEEGLTRFRHNAHWNIWSLTDQWPLSVKYREIPKAPLMIGNAGSISLPHLFIKHEHNHPFNIWKCRDSVITFNLNVEGLWFDGEINVQSDSPDVRTLPFLTGYPYLDFHRAVGKKYGGEPFDMKMQGNGWFSEMIKACNVLEKLKGTSVTTTTTNTQR